jgi:PAS domain S-box-containing protein
MSPYLFVPAFSGIILLLALWLHARSQVRNLEEKNSCLLAKVEKLDQAYKKLESAFESKTGELQDLNDRLREELTHNENLHRELERSVELYRNLIDNMQESVLVVQDEVVKFHNNRLPGISYPGISEIMHSPFRELVHPEYQEKIMELYNRLMDGRETAFTLRGKMAERPEGETWFEARASRLEWHGKPAMLICLADITREENNRRWKERIQEQLADARKMDAIGKIAFGVAHEFNNIITPIVSMSQFCMKKLGKGHDLHDALDLIHGSALKAKDITWKLLTFTGSSPMHRTTLLNLNHCLEDNEDLLRNIIEDGIHLYFEYADEMDEIKGDKNSIDQIIINLFLNAQAAVKQNGSIILKTSMEVIDADYITDHPHAWPGKFAVLSVCDNGPGISDETKRNIFAPFYSTGEVGKGEGLGLSVIYGLVKNYNGWITVDHTGSFTEFRCFFPIEQRQTGKREEPQSLEHKKDVREKGKTTVLVADDNKTFRNAIFMTLFTNGYNVIMATDGQHAIQLMEEQKGHVDIIITDLVMPDMSGFALIKKIKELYPDIPIVLTSGYYTKEEAENLMRKIASKPYFMKKPVSSSEIIEKVEAVLKQEAQ